LIVQDLLHRGMVVLAVVDRLPSAMLDIESFLLFFVYM
jgi:hypothetical protein